MPHLGTLFPKVYYVTTTAYDALRSYIDSTSEPSAALRGARDHAEEYGLPVPDESTGQLLTTLLTRTRIRTGIVVVVVSA